MDDVESESFSNGVFNNLKQADRMMHQGSTARVKDKQDRSSAEQVLDPATRLILFKWIQGGQLDQLDGCLSTGKEANVYYSPPNKAVKVYRTINQKFNKGRDACFDEFRFRHGFNKKSPPYAEREFRNLNRMHTAGIPCPKPLFVKSNVVVMEFIGHIESGLAAPLLKDADMPTEAGEDLYWTQLVPYLRTLYRTCRLVHGDLSEYNILYNAGQLVIIDVSQAIDITNPTWIDSLRHDIAVVSAFFAKKFLMPCMTIKEFFDYIVDPSITPENCDDYLARMRKTVTDRAADKGLDEFVSLIENDVFKQAYIPERLSHVYDAERDIDNQQNKTENGGSKLIYSTITGLKEDLSGARLIPKILSDGEDSNSGSESEDSDSDGENGSKASDEETDSDDDEEEDSKFKHAGRPKDETPEERKLRKLAVREAKREKRKVKVRKHVKKRKEKMSGNRKK